MKCANCRLLNFLLIGFVATLMSTGAARAWWNDEWTIRKKLTIDTTEKGVAVNEPIGGNTPVLIRLFDGNFQFTSAKEDGGDLRFVAGDDKTPLKFHIEKWDGLMGEAFVWVNVPDLKPNAQTNIWLYYGNGGPKAMRTEDAKGTYDENTALVYHFGQPNSPATDASGNNNNALSAGISVAGSMIGGGLRLGGTNGVGIAPTPSLAWSEGQALTWSAWVKLTALKPNAALFSRRDIATAKSVVIGSNNGVPYVEVAAGTAVLRSGTGAPLLVNTWHHLAVVAAGAKITLFLDGESYSTLDAAIPALNTPMFIGGNADPLAAETGAVGEMDELKISKVARPAGFIKMAALSEGGGDKASRLLTFATEEAPTNWLSGLSNGYIGIIVRSLTVDGWVVIGLLFIMAVISWFVMISKALYLNSTTKGNSIFVREWHHIANDLTVLDTGETDHIKSLGEKLGAKSERDVRNASVYRIYRIGAEEIRHRLAADQGKSSKVLRSRSIQAIRAALDAGLVREMQKLNNMMVLLTIAISGGPFLGLLGTVVGVMITFAAVAQAGDVNVNAIAPGIAAALLATVAGLAVAIPALFGYYYLLSRVKDATSDMQVFIDEFVSKMAELYGGKAEDRN